MKSIERRNTSAAEAIWTLTLNHFAKRRYAPIDLAYWLKSHEHSSTLPFYRTFSMAGEFRNAIFKHCHVLKKDPAMKDMLKGLSLSLLKRSCFIRNCMIKSSFPRPWGLPNLPYRCGDVFSALILNVFLILTRLKYITSNISSIVIRHVIYILKCPCRHG